MNTLKALGLTTYEEKVYRAAARIGRADARSISRESGVPPTAVYPNLKSLIDKGLMQKLDGEVGYFESIEPKPALSALAAKRKFAMERCLAEAISQIKKMPAAEEAREPLNVSLGKEMSSQLFSEFAGNARKSVYILGWKFSVATRDFSLLKRILKLKNEKKDIRMITNNQAPEKNWMLRQIRKNNVPIRYYPIDNFSIIVRDSEETKITLKNPAIGDRINIHIEDKDLSTAMHDYFLSLWNKSKKI
jgi:HTH-type transcriptional regulator, sugar sensing transcriptional regulator